MNEPTKLNSLVRRTFILWLIFFIAIFLMMLIADLAAGHGRIKNPRFVSEIIYSIIFASISAGLWLFIRWPFRSWRNFRRILLGVAILATLTAIFYTEEDWRG